MKYSLTELLRITTHVVQILWDIIIFESEFIGAAGNLGGPVTEQGSHAKKVGGH